MGFDEENLKQAHVASSSDNNSETSPTPVKSGKHEADEYSHDRHGSVQSYNSIPVTQDGGVLSRLRNLEAALDRKLGVESEAINRVKPEEKTPQSWHSQATMALLWASGTMQISAFATGFLGPEFGLSLGQSIAITICGSLLGAAVTGFCATLGPGTGLRQVSISRYSFGWYPSKIIAALNVISQIGWASVSCITGGLALSAVSNGRLSLVVGVIVIAVGSLVISFVGLRAVLNVDKYAWFAFLVLFLVMYGEAAPAASPAVPASVSGPSLSGAALSYLAIIYGSSASWCSISADYYVHFPVTTSKLKVFTLTTLGISLPTCLGVVLGCCVGNAMQLRRDWAAAYTDLGVGWLIRTIVYPLGFAKFLLVVLVLAGICQNCIAMYSASLSIQQFARPVAVIPRFFWTLVVFGVIVALSIAGKDKLLVVLQNLLALLGYWNTSFFVIVCTEHVVFRKRMIANYNLDAWNDPSRLPLGIAGLTAFLIGFVGWFLGMVTTWYSGPLARLIGDDGGDIGNELALVFTLVTYIPARWFELKHFGR